MHSIFIKRHILVVLISLLLFALISIGLIYPLQPGGMVLKDWQELTNNGWEPVSLPHIDYLQSNFEHITLRTTFPGSDRDTLVLPRISGNAIKVYLNQRLVYQKGDFNHPTANLWNNQLMIQLTEPLRADNNLLELEINSSVYAIGFGAVPYITDFADAARRMLLLDWIYNDSLLATSGAAIIIGVLLILLCHLRRRWWSSEYYIGISLILCVLFNQDAIFRVTSGSLSTFLLLKKSFLSSGYLASVFFIFGIEKYLFNHARISRWIAIVTIPFVLLLCVMPDLYSMNNVNLFANYILFINLVIISAMIFASPRKPAWMLMPALFVSLAVLQIIISAPLKMYFPLVIPYVLSFSTIIFGINLLLDFNRLFDENLSLQHTNRLDPLTGAMNRRAIKDLKTQAYDYVVIIDMDNFKEINDHYGHMLGDQILVEFTRIARFNLRSADLVVRWGGDEFLLAICNLPHDTGGYHSVEQVIKRIAVQYRDVHPELSLQFSYGIMEVNDSFEKSLEEADRRMYQMKGRRDEKDRHAAPPI